MFKKLLSIWFLIVLALPLAAQTTRVHGIVRDGETGKPLPFVGIYFDGTTIGISTDLDGKYSLETRSPEAKVLTASLLGYLSISKQVTQGAFTEIDFTLMPDPKQLTAATVKPDDRYIKSILRRLDRSLSANDPDNAPDWNSRLYTRIELDATNTEDLFKLGVMEKNLGYIRSYSDTSAITGKPFIPVLISENLSDLYHNQAPAYNREVMRASRISGVKQDNVLRQFTGSYLLKTSFYKNSISVFNLDIPNPASSFANVFYNYYLVDSLQVDGRKTYVLRFHPKKLVTSPTLDGEFHIDAEDFGIQSVHARLSDASNVNWLRHVNYDISYRRLPDGRWFYEDEKLFVDASITLNDNSRILSFLVHRQMHYEEPTFEPTPEKDVKEVDNPVVMRSVVQGDDSFWKEARPFTLSKREQGIYDMVDELQQRTFYKVSEEIIRSLITGYIPVDPWKVEFGPWSGTVIRNEMAGWRLQVGGRTRKELTEKLRVGGYVAYGFKSHTIGWLGTAEVMFNRETTRKLTVLAQDDFVQFGSGAGLVSNQNLFASLFPRSSLTDRQSRVRKFQFLYDHEFSPNVNTQLEWTSMRVWHNELVPFILPGEPGRVQESFSVNQLRAAFRFSWEERVNRGPFIKAYLFTKYPVVELAFTGGFKGITKDDIGYFRTDLNVSWRTPSSAIGFGRLNLDAGFISGSVPYPMLKLHEGNQTYFMDRGAFSLMDYYEFIGDRWIQGYYEHNLNGLILGMLPGIKKLDLREVLTARFAWSAYSQWDKAPFLLPPGANINDKGEYEDLSRIPYVEVGVGISNILRVLRVDAFWRLTHQREKRSNFTINVGFDVEF